MRGVAKLIEGKIERKARDHLKKLGGRMNKFVCPGRKGVPDRACSHWRCGPWLMEFKAPGKKPTPLQLKVQKEMAEEGWTVFACVDNFRMALTIIDEMLSCTPLHEMTYKPVDPL
jgi:hypothetical protein